MSSKSEVAMVGGTDRIATMLERHFPGRRVLQLAHTEARSLIQKKKLFFCITDVPTGAAQEIKTARLLSRDAARNDIPALFLAHYKDAYRRVRNAIEPSPTVGVSLGVEETEVRQMLNLLSGRIARAAAPKKPPVSLDLDSHPLLASTTSFLRNPASGRLDVKRIAGFYGEPLNRFADALGVTPAAVSQTPDSKKYQDFLGYFEQVARIVPMLESKHVFASWTKTPNKELKGEPPVEWLFGGEKKASRLAEVVEEVLVGQPD